MVEHGENQRCYRRKIYSSSVACLLLLLGLLAQSRPAAASLKVVYAVNAGGVEHTDKNGIHYEPDPLHNKIGTASDYGYVLNIIGRVPTKDEVLYRTERYHTGTFGYDLPIAGDGEYALILKFCEVYFNEPNMKVFDVVLNGEHTIVSELDIFHQVGKGTAHDEYVFFSVSRGRLFYKEEESEIRNGFVRLDFIKGVHDNPKINAFALLKGDVERIPRLPPISDDALQMDPDMAVFHDRVSADTIPAPTAATAIDEDIVELPPSVAKPRKTSGPRQPNPYSMDDTSLMLPVFIAIGAFIPLLFCLCKL